MAMKIKKKLVSIVASTVFGAVLLVLVLTKYPFREVISAFSHITPVLLIGYLTVSFTILLLFAIRWNFVMKTLGHKLPLRESFCYRVIDYGLSYITPSGKAGGEPIRAALLMRNGISFKEGLANVTTDKTIELTVSVSFFIFGILTLALGYPLPIGLRVFLVLLCTFLIFLIWKFYSRIMQGKPVFTALYRLLHLHKIKFFAKYQQAVIDFERPIIKFYYKERKAFFIALGLSVLSLLCSMVEYKLLLLMLGINASIGVVFMVFSVSGLAFLVPVPMGLGSLEAFQAALFSVLKIGAATGVGLAVITRARDLLWVLAAVALSLYYGSFKRVLREAYDDKYANPISKLTIFRDGRPKTIKIKMFRNAADEKKSLVLLTPKKK
jgi:uncharacterized protein (TIRG00374 family)